MYLTNTTETLQVILGGAVATNQSVVTVDYGDNTATTFTAGKQRSTTNGTTAVNILAAPAASTQRIVQFLTMTNADTAAITVTIRTNDGGTLGTQFGPVTLLPSERVEFATDTGFRVFDAAGAVKGAASQFIVGTYILAQLLADQNFAAGAFATCIFGNEVSDALGEYNPATGEVTIKNTGRYLICAYCQLASAADTSALVTSIFRNGVDFMRVGSQNANNPGAAINQSTQVGGATFANLTVGDVITIRGFIAVQVVGGITRFVGGAPLTNFSMMRVG